MEVLGDSFGVCEGFEKDVFIQWRGVEVLCGGVRRVLRELVRFFIVVLGMGKIVVFLIWGGVWCVGDYCSFLFFFQDYVFFIFYLCILFFVCVVEV